MDEEGDKQSWVEDLDKMVQLVAEEIQNDGEQSMSKKVDGSAEPVNPKPPDKTLHKPAIQDKNLNPCPALPDTTLAPVNPNLQNNNNIILSENHVTSVAPVNKEFPKGNCALAPKSVKTQMVKQNKNDEEENNVEKNGPDMDEESTTQNFMHIARQGDLSPRVIDKVKSAGRGKKKQQNENTKVPGSGVQTRRVVSKSIV